jgi:primosomal protein N'
MADEYLAHPGMAFRQAAPETIVRAGLSAPDAQLTIDTASQPRLHIETGLPDELAREIRTLGQRSPVLVIVPERRQIKPVAIRLDTRLTYASRLKTADQAAIWRWVIDAQPGVLVGTRAALHLPWHHMGAIVVLNEDEMAYKQDQAPRYHARAAAVKLAALTGADCHLTSVAPSLEAFSASLATSERIPTARVRGVEPDSEALPYPLWEALDRASGPSLVYAPTRQVPDTVELVTRAFPHRTVVVDRPPRGSQIAVAAQAGFRFPGPYGVVGCRGFDTLAQMADFRASEKAVSTLRKLAALTPGGQLIVEAQEAAHLLPFVTRPYQEFANVELIERQALSLPPVSRLTRLVFTGKTAAEAEAKARQAAERLEPSGLSIQSAACPIARDATGDRWQVIAAGDPKRLRPYLAAGWRPDVDPLNLL